MRCCRNSVLSLLCALSLFAATSSAELPSVRPVPQKINWTSNTECWLSVDALTGVVVDGSLSSDMAASTPIRMGRIWVPQASRRYCLATLSSASGGMIMLIGTSEWTSRWNTSWGLVSR